MSQFPPERQSGGLVAPTINGLFTLCCFPAKMGCIIAGGVGILMFTAGWGVIKIFFSFYLVTGVYNDFSDLLGLYALILFHSILILEALRTSESHLLYHIWIFGTIVYFRNEYKINVIYFLATHFFSETFWKAYGFLSLVMFFLTLWFFIIAAIFIHNIKNGGVQQRRRSAVSPTCGIPLRSQYENNLNP